jgi:glycogen phosphorylase
MNNVKDPVCGMSVFQEQALPATYGNRTFYFCSDLCRRSFLTDPERYLGPLQQAGTVGPSTRRVAYFTMEVALDPSMPTYSGGLGVLAGDTLRSFADLKIPAVGVNLLYWNGYFEQKLDEWGNQHERPVSWEPKGRLHLLPATVAVTIEERTVIVRAWQYDLVGVTGGQVPVLLLDANHPENAQQDRELSLWLYGGDDRYRLAQEIILGIGGVRMLQALGYTAVERFHMNEGHAAFLTLQLLRESTPNGSTEWNFPAVRRRCVFTTHTPVPAGHDQFTYDLVRRVMGDFLPLEVLQMLGGAGPPQHDAPRLQHEHLYQRRGQAARRSLATNVSSAYH